jgi:predicted GTPase
MSRKMPGGTKSALMFHVFQSDGKKNLLLKANNQEIFMKWTTAISKAGATIKDSPAFVAELSDPQFTLVPIGGSGVGKSTLCNLLMGSMWVDKTGCAVGYEDSLFKTSAGVNSQTTAEDTVVVLRQWCGGRTIFAVMDTPGIFDVAGTTADAKNISAVVKKLQHHQKVECFVLVLNAAESRFSTQQAQVIELFDRILSSESAGSFLEHAVIVINQARRPHFANEQQTKKDYVGKIRDSLRALKMQEKEEWRAALFEQCNGSTTSMYDNDALFTRLESRCVLFPAFDAQFSYRMAQQALKQMLEYTLQLVERGSFDCTAVRTANTKEQELEKRLQEKEDKISEMQDKMDEMQEREAKLDMKQAGVAELIAEAKGLGLDTSKFEEYIEAQAEEAAEEEEVVEEENVEEEEEGAEAEEAKAKEEEAKAEAEVAEEEEEKEEEKVEEEKEEQQEHKAQFEVVDGVASFLCSIKPQLSKVYACL